MDPEDVEALLALLARAGDMDPDDADYQRIEQAAAHLRKTAKKRRRSARRRATAAHDRAVLAATALARHQDGRSSPDAAADASDEADAPTSRRRDRICYVCKGRYRTPHAWYPSLCAPCGDRSLHERDLVFDATGRRALVTGGRIKVGHATALALLRAGAEVHVTTRYPHDAARRFAQEPDADTLRERLVIHGLDFRRLDHVLGWLDGLAQEEPFDIVVNNAAQTVWRAPEAVAALVRDEAVPAPHGYAVNRVDAAATSEHALDAATTLPDVLGGPLPLDLHRRHSWVARLEDVDPVEMIEVQVVNAVVPFLIVQKLHGSLLRSPHADRYVINVTAVEGQFARPGKSERHPHTNMAKAALNMLTCTSAQDLVRDGIHMVAVDPGWMSHEGPPEAVSRAYEEGFRPPLEARDCAARVLDPIKRGLAGAPIHGVLLKDFDVVPW